MAGRASIVGAAATHVGKVREHNEDAHYFDADAGLFVVCDGMGGHAAGEVASGIAIRTIRSKWSANDVQDAIDLWLNKGTPEAKKAMLGVIRAGALAAHDAILAEAAEDEEKSGMGTTLVGALVVGNELVFAHAGDSRAYIVRDNIAMQLTEDHTLLSRLLAAGIEVDVSGEGSRFRSMLTNALGIGQECKVSTFVVPLADGDRFLLCSDGISEYVPEPEIGTVLTSSPSPARAAQKLIELALDRGGGDNATAVVIRVLEAGETPQPVELRRKDDAAIQSCALWDNVSPQQRLRALRIAISRDVAANERLPAHTLGERVAWIIIEGKLEKGGRTLGPGALVYPESLIADTPAPDRDSLAITRSDVRGLVLRYDDFRELCEDDPELAELLHETLGKLVSKRGGVTTQSEGSEDDVARMPTLDPDKPSASSPKLPRSRAETSELAEPPPPVAPPLPITIPEDVIPLTKPKKPEPEPAAAKPMPVIPAPVKIMPPKEPKPIPSLVGKPKPVAPAVPTPIVPEASPDVVDLGSELRADLGGEHAVPKRKPSSPKVELREPTVPPVRQSDLEVEMEEVVEIDAEPPPAGPAVEAGAADVEMTVEDDDDDVEMTVEMTADEPADEPDDDKPVTAETKVVSGRITIPEDKPGKARAKRLSEGWGDD